MFNSFKIRESHSCSALLRVVYKIAELQIQARDLSISDLCPDCGTEIQDVLCTPSLYLP